MFKFRFNITICHILGCFDDSIELPILSDSMTCRLQPLCSAIKCCVDVDFLRTSFMGYVTLDPCNYKIKVGIEKIAFEKTLNAFDFGVKQQIDLLGVVQIEWVSWGILENEHYYTR